MRRNHALRRLKPEGLWRPPLTDEQIAQAIEFGANVATQGDFAVHDVFLIEFNQALNATISISTVFERLAVYASQQARRGEPIDPAFVDTVRSLPIFDTRYILDITSPHKRLNVVRFWPVKSRAEMTVLDQQRLGKNQYRLIAAFPYRDVDYTKVYRPLGLNIEPVDSEKGVEEQFEVSAQSLFSKTAIDIIVDLRLYH